MRPLPSSILFFFFPPFSSFSSIRALGVLVARVVRNLAPISLARKYRNGSNYDMDIINGL